MPSIAAAKQALLLAQIMHTAAYSALNVARPLRPVQLPSLRPRQSHNVVLHAAAEAAGDDAVDEAPAPTGLQLCGNQISGATRHRRDVVHTGLRAKLKKAASFKKGDLAKYGVSAFFAYGFVSNVNSCLLLSFTWATFRRANPALSPLADAAVLANPLTWLPLKKKFLAYYMGYYLSIGSILRPFRFAIALGLAPTFEKTYVKISDRLKVPRAVSIFIVTILTNVVFTVGLLLVAVNLFCAALRVAPVPL